MSYVTDILQWDILVFVMRRAVALFKVEAIGPVDSG